MVRFITVLLLALGVGFILIPVVDAKDNSNEAYSQLFLFRVQPGATWQSGESPLTKGKPMTGRCVSVNSFDQASSQPLGTGKVCLSGQDNQKEAISKRGLTIYIYFNTKDTLGLSVPDATVVNLTKAMAASPPYAPIVISSVSEKDTNAVLSGTGKFRDVQGRVDVFGVVDTIAVVAEEEESQTERKVPILGDIPVLGALFRSN